MELNVFMRELESALVQRGIPNETALRHVSNLKRTLTEDDLSEIEGMRSSEQIDALADSLAVILNRKRTAQTQPAADRPPMDVLTRDDGTDAAPYPPAQNAPYSSLSEDEPQPGMPDPAGNAAQRPSRPPQERPPSSGRPSPVPQEDYPAAYPLSGSSYDDEEEDESEPVQEYRKPRKKEPPAPARRKEQRKSVDDYFEYGPDAAPSTKGMIIFWVGLFITLPITIAIAAVVFGIFAVLFVAMAALIVASIAVVIALVAGGAVTSLVAVVFGITQLFHIGGGTVIAGIYEIGLGVMVAGIVLFLSVLLYNFAIRFLPWVIGKLGTFLSFLCGKAKDLFLYVRRECYQL